MTSPPPSGSGAAARPSDPQPELPLEAETPLQPPRRPPCARLPSPPGPAAASSGARTVGRGEPREREEALARLLAELGPEVRLGVEPGSGSTGGAASSATGIEALDRLLGGGFPRGRLCELTGPESGGRTSLLFAWLARLTATGAWAAWVDRPDALDPASAEAAGVDLTRVLWIRPPETAAALRAAEHVLAAGGFAGLVLDLTPPVTCGAAAPSSRTRRTRAGDTEAPPASAWQRLRRAAAAAEATLVVTARTRLAGACADLALETGPARARFGEGPAWLEGLEASVRLVRRRGGPEGRAAPLSWRTAA